MTVTLCILAGGRSRRFGSSKLRVQFVEHETGQRHWLLAHQASRLGSALGCSRRWLSVSPANPAPPGYLAYRRRIVDERRDIGPLAGMAAVLAHAGPHDTFAFVPADMPLVDPAYLRQLIRAAERTDRSPIAMGRWASGPRCGVVEPFPCACCGVNAFDLIRRAIRAGVRAPLTLARWRGVRTLPLGWPRDCAVFVNFNRVNDLTTVRSHLGDRWDIQEA